MAELIVALDMDLERAERLVQELTGLVRYFKVGAQLFTRTGPAAVEMVHRHGGEVFLDLKYHDTPDTVDTAALAAGEMGVWMFTVHAMGGVPMMRAAIEGSRRRAPRRPLVIAVTILTSIDQITLERDLGLHMKLEDHVIHLATISNLAGLDGIVASAHEARLLKRRFGDGWIIVTPGIRLLDTAFHDQVRRATPKTAVAEGADYLVVGRPITTSPNAIKTTQAILEEMRF